MMLAIAWGLIKSKGGIIVIAVVVLGFTLGVEQARIALKEVDIHTLQGSLAKVEGERDKERSEKDEAIRSLNQVTEDRDSFKVRETKALTELGSARNALRIASDAIQEEGRRAATKNDHQLIPPGLHAVIVGVCERYRGAGPTPC